VNLRDRRGRTQVEVIVERFVPQIIEKPIYLERQMVEMPVYVERKDIVPHSMQAPTTTLSPPGVQRLPEREDSEFRQRADDIYNSIASVKVGKPLREESVKVGERTVVGEPRVIHARDTHSPTVLQGGPGSRTKEGAAASGLLASQATLPGSRAEEGAAAIGLLASRTLPVRLS